MHYLKNISAAILVSIAVFGCAAFPPQICPADLKPMSSAELYFGRAIPGGGEVGDADWQRFLDAEVTPRFPGGFTVQDASGQWQGAGGIVREPSKHLTIVLNGAADETKKLAAIRAAYKNRFRQEAVLLVEYRGCGSF
jgi:hypothetical protein